MHPDRNSSAVCSILQLHFLTSQTILILQNATQEFQLIQEAYETITRDRYKL
jgi:curved DNA-binding protein CbpA